MHIAIQSAGRPIYVNCEQKDYVALNETFSNYLAYSYTVQTYW